MATEIITQETNPPPNAPDPVRLSPHAALILVDDGSPVLLDMNGDFYGISDIGALMLKHSLSQGQQAAASAIAARFGVDVGRVAADLEALLSDLETRGVILRQTAPKPRRFATLAAGMMASLLKTAFRVTRRPRSRAALALLLSRISFALFGWNATVDAWRARFPEREPSPSEAAIDPAIDESVREMAASNWLGVDCKERALSCFAMARAEGRPAALNIGIALYPLGGHCWCTTGDAVIGDDQNRYRTFIPVFQFS